MSGFSSIFSGIFTGASGSGTQQAGAYEHISQQEASDIMASGAECIILDVRRPDEFASGHIPGAVNIPNESIGSAELPMLPEKDALLLVYCRSGARSRQAAAKLAALGYSNIKDFGGIMTWQGQIVTD